MAVLQRVRGVLGIGVVWGVTLSAIGTAFILAALATGLIPHVGAVGWAEWIALAVRVATRDFVLGGVVGAVFAMLLAGAERRRTVESLSLRRVGAWGFLASAVPIAVAGLMSGAPIPASTWAAGTIASGLVGAGLGVGMLRLARRGPTTVSANAEASIV